MKLYFFLVGWKRLHVDAVHQSAAVNLCLEGGFEVGDFQASENGVSFSASSRTAKKLQSLAAARDIPLETVARGGFLFSAFKYRKRVGAIVGLAAALFLLFLSGHFVWDVRVTGNTTLTDSEVIDELKACGFGVGSRISSFDARRLENRVLLLSNRIAWISVNLEGTVAKVQIRENEQTQEKKGASPANLVATSDGQIEYLELFRGNPCVKAGDAVKKGDLLVSGIYDSERVGFRLTRAAGKVMARTEKKLTVEIPLSYTEKVYSERKRGDITLYFFDKSYKILKNTGKEEGACDIIEKEFDWDLTGSAPLPIRIGTTTLLPYETVEATRTQEEALEAAYRVLQVRLSALAEEDTALLEKRISTELTDTAVILTCTVVSVENIASQLEFEYTP